MLVKKNLCVTRCICAVATNQFVRQVVGTHETHFLPVSLVALLSTGWEWETIYIDRCGDRSYEQAIMGMCSNSNKRYLMIVSSF